jgi:hypothetical protein
MAYTTAHVRGINRRIDGVRRYFNLAVLIAAGIVAVVGLVVGCDVAELAALCGGLLAGGRLLMLRNGHEKPPRAPKDPVERVRELTAHPERWVWERGWRRR